MHTTKAEDNIASRLRDFRAALKSHQLDAWIFPTNDPHQSEYVADHWKSREWITGFSGSAGLAIVTAQNAGLWTDSRYFLQAETQLAGSEVKLHKMGQVGVLNSNAWLSQHLPEGARVGMDGKLLAVAERETMEKAFAGKKLKLVTDLDLITEAWKDRPALPLDEIQDHPVRLAGQIRSEKLNEIRQGLRKSWTDYHFLSTLDDIAWLFNLRGSDVQYNPVFYAYALIGWKTSILFADPRKVPETLELAMEEAGTVLAAYDELGSYLEKLEGKVLIDPAKTSVTMIGKMGKKVEILNGPAPSTLLKSRKNDIEIGHIRNVMVRDGVALLRLYRWLEKEVPGGKVTEAEVGDKLNEFRAQQKGFRGPSFGAIAGFKGNGAIVHYQAEHGKSATLESEGMFLLDSGGQYVDGTTDITRTICFGTPTAEQQRDYTLVLKGHIALAEARFPAGTSGYQLDTLARMPLWQHGLEYGHGTGHGVGFFLNVHEGPQGIRGSHNGMATTVFEPGMLTSNEPGFYKATEYGIRIENLILCVEVESTDYGKFLGFETVSLFPIDTELVNLSLLLESERKWLNAYHVRVLEALKPELDAGEIAWLEEKCKAI